MSKKFHIHIDADNEEALKKELKELAYILTGLREYTKIWSQEYGSASLRNKKVWEQKADEWIEKHKIIIEE